MFFQTSLVTIEIMRDDMALNILRTEPIKFLVVKVECERVKSQE
jgi:hypothetical protein